jgi:hypothetical protein
MTGFTSGAPDHLVRSNLWSSQLKDVLEDELMATKYVEWLTDFPDGETFNIPSIGQMQVMDYTEDTAVQYRAMDTGNLTFSITEYLQTGTYVTNKAKQDSMYMNELISTFVPKQNRAIMARVEADVLGLSASQTAGATNAINGASHRFVGTGTNETIAIADFAKALYGLKKANVPQTDLIAIVDPSVEYTLNTVSNLVNVSNNPRWEGIVSSGIASGMRFIKNVYGFDVYTSNYLADANETIGALTTAAGKANMFFSAAADVRPFMGAWRQKPKVDSEYNKDLQRDEYVTTARYGVKLKRPENLVCVLTDTDQV